MVNLKIDGKAVEHIVALELDYIVNDIPRLRLQLDIAHEKTFSGNLGKPLKLTTAKGIVLFDGILTNLEFSEDEYGETLVLIGFSKLITLTQTKSLYFHDKKAKDDVLIKAVLKEHGLTAVKVAASTIESNQFFSYQLSGWRLMMWRCRENGFLLNADPEATEIVDGVKFKASAAKTTHKLDKKLDEYFSINTAHDMRSQVDNVSAFAWDASKAKSTAGKAKNAKYALGFGATKTKFVTANKLPNNITELSPPQKGEKMELPAKVDAAFRQLSWSTGKISLPLEDESKWFKVKTLDAIELKNFSDLRNGKYLVGAIHHRLVNQQWTMDIELGIPLARTLYSDYAKPEVMPMMTARVAKFKGEDPEKLNRLLVTLPSGAKTFTLWASLLSPLAGTKHGLFLQPAADDTVMLDFIGGDCRYPVVVGSYLSGKGLPAGKLAEKPDIQGLMLTDKGDKPLVLQMSKEKSQVELNAEKGITCVTKKGTITADEQGGVTVECEELTAKTKKPITLESGDKIVLKATTVEIA